MVRLAALARVCVEYSWDAVTPQFDELFVALADDR